MASREEFNFFLLIIFITKFPFLTSERNYDIVLYDIKCNAMNEYIQNLNCTNYKSPPRVSAEFIMKKVVERIALNFNVMVPLKNKKSTPVFKAMGMELCDLITKDVSSPVLKSFRNSLLSHSNYPNNCSIPENFHFKLYNYTWDTDSLPTHLPETTFIASLGLQNKKTMFIEATVLGKIVYKNKQKKGRKTF